MNEIAVKKDILQQKKSCRNFQKSSGYKNMGDDGSLKKRITQTRAKNSSQIHKFGQNKLIN